MTRLLIGVESIAIVILLLGVLAISSVQVIGRYFLNVSVPWSEEISQVVIVWLAFIGAALVSAKSDHVTMRVLGSFLGRRGRIALALFAYVVIIGSCLTLIVIGVEPTAARMSLPLPATRWPAGLTYAGALAGVFLIGIHSAINALVVVRGGYDEATEDLEDGVI